MPATVPSLSVIICTRDRGAQVLGTVQSILASPSVDLEVLVIDQSGDSSLEAALTSLQSSTPIRYVRSDTRGLSAARNVGLRLAQSELVGMTDDDCTVAPGWAAGIHHAFAQHPDVALLFGNVVPAPFDAAAGFIPRYERATPCLAVGLQQKMAVEGIGACMALRRDAVLALGGFDEMLGAGGPFHAGEDVDLTLRVLGSGHAVYETPAVGVVHAGFHPWTSSRPLVRSYWFGAGAAFGKNARMRGPVVVGLLGRLAWRFLAGHSPVARGLGVNGANGLARLRLAAFVEGLGAGVSTPVDRTTGHFQAARARGTVATSALG